MKKVFYIITLSAFVLFFACGRYEDGPEFSLRSVKNRITGSWKVDKFYIDGIDSTDEFNSKLGCKIDFNLESFNGADHIWKCILNNCNNNSIFQGDWWFYDNKIKMIHTYFIDDSTFISAIGPFGKGRSTKWTILRLTNKEFNLTTDNWHDIAGIAASSSVYLLNLKKQ
ncbi:MAG: hypothetical protein HGB12_02335 [Bacteroidetes bacterium]|nr:hypothetical protein [Bacteroidota bacterium]